MNFNDFMSLIFIGLFLTYITMIAFQGFFKIFDYSYVDDVRLKINFKNDS